jgi:hypothetical protein
VDLWSTPPTTARQRHGALDVSELLKRFATEGDVPRRALAKQAPVDLLGNIALNVVHVVRISLTSVPRKYHAPLAIMVTCGQSWTIKNGELAASI